MGVDYTATVFFGTTIDVDDLEEFCEEHDLNYTGVGNFYSGDTEEYIVLKSESTDCFGANEFEPKFDDGELRELKEKLDKLNVKYDFKWHYALTVW